MQQRKHPLANLVPVQRTAAHPRRLLILIEVKYREGAPIKDDDAIAELCAEASAAIVVT